MTAIIDYKAGNLTSVKNAFAALGAETLVTSDPKAIAAADHVVFPGVGAAKSAIENLRDLGLVEAVKADANSTISQSRYGRNQPPPNHEPTIPRVESESHTIPTQPS